MRGKWYSQFCALILCALFPLMLLCSACSGDIQSASAPESDTTNPVAEEELVAGNIEFPLPGEVTRDVSNVAGGFRHGREYLGDFAGRVEQDGYFLEFRPSVNGDLWQQGEYAWAMYEFHVRDYQDEPTLSFVWRTPPLDSSLWYIGLSDWDNNSWKWFPGEIYSTLTLEALDPFINHDGRILAAVVVSGNITPVLANVHLGQLDDQLEIEFIRTEEFSIGFRDLYSLKYEIDLLKSPYSVDIDTNYNPNAIPGFEAASFGVTYPQNVSPLARNIGEAGPREDYRYLGTSIAGYYYIAIEITDDFNNSKVIWCPEPVYLETNWRSFEVTDVRPVAPLTYEVDLEFSMWCGYTPPIDVYLDPDYHLDIMNMANPLASFGDVAGELLVGTYSFGGEKSATVVFQLFEAHEDNLYYFALRTTDSALNMDFRLADPPVYLPPWE